MADKDELKCDRCGKPTEGLHSCPYQQDVNDNNDGEWCNCCDSCEHECMMDI